MLRRPGNATCQHGWRKRQDASWSVVQSRRDSPGRIKTSRSPVVFAFSMASERLVRPKSSESTGLSRGMMSVLTEALEDGLLCDFSRPSWEDREERERTEPLRSASPLSMTLSFSLDASPSSCAAAAAAAAAAFARRNSARRALTADTAWKHQHSTHTCRARLSAARTHLEETPLLQLVASVDWRASTRLRRIAAAGPPPASTALT